MMPAIRRYAVQRAEALAQLTGASGPGIRAAAAHGLRLWLTNGVVAALGFVAPLAFVRLSGPEEYGRFSLVASIIAIANIVTLPGLNISLRQAVARGFHGSVTQTAKLRMRWATLATGGMLLGGWWITARGDRVTGGLLMAVSPLIPLIHGIDVAQWFLNGAQRFTALSTWMIVGAAVPSVVVVAMLLSGIDAAAAALGFFGAVAGVNAASYAWVLRCRRNTHIDETSVPYGKRLTFITLLGTVQSYLDKLIVGGLLSLEALAMYSVGKLFQQALTITWGALSQLYAPKLASRPADQARHLTRSTLPYVWISFAALAGGVIIAAPGIVSTVFGETYEPSVAVARILTLGVLATIPGAQFEVLFTSTGDEPRLYRQRSLFASTQLILVGSGAYVFGLDGAVWGNALTYALNSLYGFLLDRQRR